MTLHYELRLHLVCLLVSMGDWNLQDWKVTDWNADDEMNDK